MIIMKTKIANANDRLVNKHGLISGANERGVNCEKWLLIRFCLSGRGIIKFLVYHMLRLI